MGNIHTTDNQAPVLTADLLPLDTKAVRTQGAGCSWAVWFWTNAGTVFVNSDWGCYSTHFGAPGEPIEKFLASIDTDYLFNRFESALSFNGNGKCRDMTKAQKERLGWHFKALQGYLQQHGGVNEKEPG